MPLLHYFNPGHETAVLNGSPYYMPPANVLLMQKELAFLPAWYASEKDFILTETLIPADFLQELFNNFGTFATPVTRQEIINRGSSLPFTIAFPWGISPQSLQLYKQLKEESNWQLELPLYDEAYWRLCGRQTAALYLHSLIHLLPFPDRSILPRFRSSLEEIENIILTEAHSFVLKAPYSSSGRGLLWVSEKLSNSDKQWIKGILKKQNSISIEPVLNKQIDFAMEFYCDGKGNVYYQGLSLFHTEKYGCYKGNMLDTQEEIKKQITTFLSPGLLDEIQESLGFLLQDTVSNLYKGYVGIDMMVYLDKENRACLHPCVEINMRCTMGLLALSLSNRFVSKGSKGIFTIEYHPTRLWEHHYSLQKANPKIIKNGKIISGYLPLCPITEKNKYLAYIDIYKK